MRSARSVSRNGRRVVGPREHDHRGQMILQILADGQVDERVHADLFQMIGGADARQHQEVRRVERAAGEDHLAVGGRLHLHAVVRIGDAARAGSVHDDARDVGAGFHAQVRALLGRAQEGVGGGRAAPVADRVLAAAEALALRAVVIVRHRQARLARRLHPRGEQRIVGLGEFGAERAVAAAIFIGAALPGLAAAEIGQAVGVAPAVRAVPRPAVVIAAVAARVGHDVDGGGAAQHLAARGLDAAALERLFRLGVIAPVEHRPVVHLAHAERDVDERVPVARASLQQQNAAVRVLRQPVGEHAARGARADDDVVVCAGGGHFRPCLRVSVPHTIVYVCANGYNGRAISSMPRTPAGRETGRAPP